jgi:GAF domain-containing protein
MQLTRAGVIAVANINSININGYAKRHPHCRQPELLRIPGRLHAFDRWDDLLVYITRLVRVWLRVEGAAVMLLTPDAREMIVEWASHVNPDVGPRLKAFRFPVGPGCCSGKAMVVEDYAGSRRDATFFDVRMGFVTRNLLYVPFRMQNRVIGALCAVDKRKGRFNSNDMDLLGAIADVAAWPIENMRLNAAMHAALEQVRQLRSAREVAIQHLSHELKTPLSILSASIALLLKRSQGPADAGRRTVNERIERNLQRLFDMAYELEDMLRDQEV